MPASTQIDDAADKADKVLRDAEKRIGVLADRVEKAVYDGLEILRTRGKAYAETASQSVDEAQRYVTEQVQERPLTATFTALGVGVLLGLILAGGRSSNR